MTLHATTSQTVGPFFSIGFDRLYLDDLSASGVSGQRVEIEGCVLDANAQGVPDAVIEIWQANAHGKYAHPDDRQDKRTEPSFLGFGRIPTQQNGTFRFATIKPGRVPGPHGKLQAPHIVVSIFARGLMRRLVTRIYFPDDPANSEDYALSLVEPSRRHTLIAKRSPKGEGIFEWNIVLQGPDETVFFDC